MTERGPLLTTVMCLAVAGWVGGCSHPSDDGLAASEAGIPLIIVEQASLDTIRQFAGREVTLEGDFVAEKACPHGSVWRDEFVICAHGDSELSLGRSDNPARLRLTGVLRFEHAGFHYADPNRDLQIDEPVVQAYGGAFWFPETYTLWVSSAAAVELEVP